MKAKSEFQIALEKVLNKEIKTPSEPTKMQENIKVDFIFSQPNFEIKFFKPNTKVKYKSQPKTKALKQEPLKKVVEEIKPEPVKRIKRKLTFDQTKAMENFIKLGEKNINDESTLNEIKAAYRRLAKKFHPDINPKGISEFKVLSQNYKKLIQGF
ncbi:MAG: J domain-containing protein [Oligoflexia bacterium]|nr:J domain-containing protein [Oligoflexia bacterium]